VRVFVTIARIPGNLLCFGWPTFVNDNEWVSRIRTHLTEYIYIAKSGYESFTSTIPCVKLRVAEE
jgi:hypothetical protein